jgi:Icc-related predicted phosphoesterase
MVRLLLLGDLHLSTTGPSVPQACPDLDSLDVDAIVSIGDIVDDNKIHADDPAAGAAYEERGRAFFSRLNEIGVPIIAVPGNHDPVECTHRLTTGLDNITVAHRCVVDGTTLQSDTLNKVCFVGWGCDQFDLTPAFRYDQYTGIVPKDVSTENHAQIARESATTIEAVISQYLSSEFDGSAAAAAELGVAPPRQETCANELDALADEFDAIHALLAEANETTVLLSHESPFHVHFDYHHSGDGLRQRLHHGSIPLKMAIAATGPDVVFSGHMHTEGRDAIETTNGYADLYNPGSPGVAIVEIDTETGSLQSE